VACEKQQQHIQQLKSALKAAQVRARCAKGDRHV
jgi:hypothetical protein